MFILKKFTFQIKFIIKPKLRSAFLKKKAVEYCDQPAKNASRLIIKTYDQIAKVSRKTKYTISLRKQAIE